MEVSMRACAMDIPPISGREPLCEEASGVYSAAVRHQPLSPGEQAEKVKETKIINKTDKREFIFSSRPG